MKTLRNILLTACFSLVGRQIAAQDYVDIAKLTYSNSAVNHFKNGSPGSRLEEIGLDLNIPIPLGDRTALISGMIYEGIRTQLYTEQDRKTVSSIMLKAGVNRIHSERWSGTYLLLPKLSSDFAQSSNRNFQLGCIAILKYNKADHVKYKVGVYANTELFGPWVVPIVGMYYLSNNRKFETNLTLPLAADLNYKLHPLVDIGMNFSGQVRTYYLHDTASPSGSGYLARSTNELFSYLKFNLGKSSIVQLKLGHSLGRSYRVFDGEEKVSFGLPLVYFNDAREQLNTDFKDGLIYQIALVYRVSTVK